MVSKFPQTKYHIFSLLCFLILMASSSSTIKSSYDVFLSFRGTDVRKNFVDHLYAALVQNGIHTYLADEELSKGEEISPALMEAIEESQIAIVVFSEDYASSTWCLDEVAKIMERKEQKHLEVFPLFYKVKPNEVRTPRQSYRKAMDKHEGKFGKDSDKVNRWKDALLKAGSLSGLHFTDGYEAKLIQHIVLEISARLARGRLEVAKYPVGLDSRVQEVKTILNPQSMDDVLMVGLWGQGGIGKTTLAKAIYNVVFKEFQGSCFLERVRENSQSPNGLVTLQGKLLSAVMGTEFTVCSAARGSCLIQGRLHNKKVLIILDDVDDAVQLNALAGNRQWFGNGSRIIITTRNKRLLIPHGISQDHIYEVKVLGDGEACKLFRKHAFQINQEIDISSNLVDRVVYYANGLPLALEVLGSFLRDRGEHEWKSTLWKLFKIPDQEINDVLKVSYDGLDDYVKEIFLDIACFFKGQKTKYVGKVLHSFYDLGTTIGVKILIERSMIREEHRTLQMHDLIQSMGMDIVQEKCRDDPEKCSRLWLHDDVLNVLSGDMGTDAIKAIVLKLPKPEEMHIGPNAFMSMKKLRLLILHNVHNSFQGPIHFPNELRWFEWPNCASIPEFGYGQKKLVGLDLRNSNIEGVLKQFQDFKNLKFINFSGCQSLVCMPDLGYTPHLEELDLSGCNNLERAHKSVAYHGKLRLLNFSGCTKLQPLDVLHLKNLERLILANCPKLQRFPNGLDRAKLLQKLDLNGTSIEELPASIGSLVLLEKMNLSQCKKLAILPSSIYRLQKLKKLELGGCSKLIKFPKEEQDSSDPCIKTGFPMLRELGLSYCNLAEAEFLENPSGFPILQSLNMTGNKFTNLSTSRQLSNLDRLYVRDCQQLQEILQIPSHLNKLEARGCKSLSKITSDIGQVDVVDLSSCHELVRHGFTVNDLFKLEHWCTNRWLQVCLPGGEMPEWLIPNNEGHISFMASKDLFEKKFIGLAFCVVFRGNEGKTLTLAVDQLLNGKCVGGNFFYYKADSDHMVFHCYKNWWRRDNFGPNGWSHFQLIIRAMDWGCATVKKCGFRLIFKLLENDLEVLRQHNPLLDPALFHMVRDDDSPTSTMEESSSKREDLLDSKASTEENTSSNLVLEWSKMADFSLQKHRYSNVHHHLRNVCPGGEMPEEFIPVEDDTICFMASQDFYDKIIGLALCVVFSVEDGQKEVSFDILPHVNGQKRNVQSGALGSFDSDHVWFQYLKSSVLWGMLEGGVDFGEFGKSYLRFSLSLKVSGGTVKKLGYVIRCMELEDDLKVVLENNQLVNLASLCEDSLHFADSELGLGHVSQHERREYNRKCHLHMEEQEADDSETDEKQMKQEVASVRGKPKHLILAAHFSL